MYWPPVAAAMRGFKMVLLTASRRNTIVRVFTKCPSGLYMELASSGTNIMGFNFGSCKAQEVTGKTKPCTGTRI